MTTTILQPTSSSMVREITPAGSDKPWRLTVYLKLQRGAPDFWEVSTTPQWGTAATGSRASYEAAQDLAQAMLDRLEAALLAYLAWKEAERGYVLTAKSTVEPEHTTIIATAEDDEPPF